MLESRLVPRFWYLMFLTLSDQMASLHLLTYFSTLIIYFSVYIQKNMLDMLLLNNSGAKTEEVQRGEARQDQTWRNSSRAHQGCSFLLRVAAFSKGHSKPSRETVKALPDSLSCHRVTR